LEKGIKGDNMERPVCKSLGLLACLCALSTANAVASQFAQDLKLDDPARCAHVPDPAAIKFEDHTLIEAPDLPPALRQVNTLISAQCETRAEELRDEFVGANPDDYTASFVNARISWILGNKIRAKSIGEAVLRRHPQFSSMLVLMASLAVEDKDYEHAQKLLDQVDRLQPDDLWAYIDRLVMEADLAPTRSLYKELRAIMLNTEFPTGARQSVYNAARFMQGTTDADRDELFAAMMGKPDTAKDCVLANQAIEVIEFRGDAKAGARLIEDNLRRSGACMATPLVRVLLAEAYLLQAARIARRPNAKNATMIREAKGPLDGDLTGLAHRVAQRSPLLDPIVPFLKDGVDRRGVDDAARTVVCDAVAALNPLMVKEELDNGANPNSACDDSPSLINRLLMTATVQHVPERQSILRSLLEHGAPVEGIDICASNSNKDCTQNLLPILKEFDAKRAQTRVTL